jgi:membrane-bound ClpP family serine protease
MPEIALPLRIVGLGVSGVIAAIFFLFGLFASKLQRWAFIVGIVLYSLDAILVLIFQDWFGFIFHLVMLWGAGRGMVALNKVNQSLPKVASNSSFPTSSSS